MATISLQNFNFNGGNNMSMVSEPKPLSWTEINGCKNFDRPVSIAEAIEAVNADYTVTKEHLCRIPDNIYDSIMRGENVPFTVGKNSMIDDYMATVRTDTDRTLGVVGYKYGVVQNSKAFEFIDLLTKGIEGSDGMVIETAGIIDEGRRMYVSAKMPSDIYIDGEKDPINDYILFTNSHDGSGAVKIMYTPVRVVCTNTLNLALRTATNSLIYKHTLNVNARLEFTRKENISHAIGVLESHRKYTEAFKQKLFDLAQEKVSEKDVVKFATNICLGNKKAELRLLADNDYKYQQVDEISTTMKNRITSMVDSIEGGIGQNQYRGTKLWLINGLTTFFSNEKKYKTGQDKMKSLIEGTAYDKLNEAAKILAA